MGKRKDPPKDAGGREHQVLPASRGGGIASVADESNWAMHDLPPGKTVGVGMGTHLDQAPPKDANASRRQELQRVESGGPGGPRPHSDRLRAKRITVGTAKSIIGPAHEVLIGLSIPNDLSEAHRDLFLELLRTIEDLQQSLADPKDENRRLSDEPEEFRKKLDDALPLWKRAWETFVLKSAEGAGASVGKGAVFTAGFIAGMTYSAFAAEPPGIPI